MNVDYRLIGRRIREKRKDKRWTQERLAEELSVSVGYVSQVERGATRISLDLLAEIAARLDCDLSYFVSGAAVERSDYLSRELTEKAQRLSPERKQILLDIADVLLDALRDEP